MKDVNKELQESEAAAAEFIRENFVEICKALVDHSSGAYSPVLDKLRLMLIPNRSFEESTTLAANLVSNVIDEVKAGIDAENATIQ